MDVIVRVVIRGRVQGIGYRAWTEITALEQGVEGWVRNCRDGSVEGVVCRAEGGRARHDRACADRAARSARVDGIDQRAARSEDLALRRRGELFSVLATV